MMSLWNDPFFSDPFSTMMEDPFMTGFPMGRRPRHQHRLTGSTRGGMPGTTDQRMMNLGQGQGGMWDFNNLLSQPLIPSLKEEEKQYLMTVMRPSGLNKEDLKIEVNENMLTISGEHKEESRDDKGGRSSSSYTSFYRSMTLPDNVDPNKISASMQQDGSLKLCLPKMEGMEQKKKMITIS